MYGTSSFSAYLREIRDLTRQIRGCLQAQSMWQGSAAADGGLVAEVAQNFQLVQRGLLEAKGESEKDCAEQIKESEAAVRKAQDKLDHACKHRDLYSELQINYQALIEQKPKITEAIRAEGAGQVLDGAGQVLDGVYKVSIVSTMIDRGQDVSDVVGKLNGCADAKKVVKEIAAIKEKLRKSDVTVPDNSAECEQRLKTASERIASLEKRLKSAQSRHDAKAKRLDSRLEKENKGYEKEMRQTQREMQRVSTQAQEHERYMQILGGMNG